LPRGGPEGMNTQAHSEQPHPSICFTRIISLTMSDYSLLGGNCAKWDCVVSVSMSPYVYRPRGGWLETSRWRAAWLGGMAAVEFTGGKSRRRSNCAGPITNLCSE
jgi:hypothetical protein